MDMSNMYQVQTREISNYQTCRTPAPVLGPYDNIVQESYLGPTIYESRKNQQQAPNRKYKQKVFNCQCYFTILTFCLTLSIIGFLVFYEKRLSIDENSIHSSAMFSGLESQIQKRFKRVYRNLFNKALSNI